MLTPTSTDITVEDRRGAAARFFMRRQGTTTSDLAYYEGLVRKTAGMYERFIEEEYEDVCQILRIKVWRALGTYDPSRSRMPVERYVFSCVRNQVKDLVKKVKRDELFIEDVAEMQAPEGGTPNGMRGEKFNARYLVEREDEAFAELANLDLPLIPSTLTDLERGTLALLYMDYSQAEIALRLGASKREVALAVKELRVKMADWRPSGEGKGSPNSSRMISERRTVPREGAQVAGESGEIRVRQAA